mmetsp:Transcript_37174/g.96021  ORF Transcript_37174/g.96021 Transcript_37174/m.96021 type:complete len:241 (+) Transcript_37174:477-1199(+)
MRVAPLNLALLLRRDVEEPLGLQVAALADREAVPLVARERQRRRHLDRLLDGHVDEEAAGEVAAVGGGSSRSLLPLRGADLHDLLRAHRDRGLRLLAPGEVVLVLVFRAPAAEAARFARGLALRAVYVVHVAVRGVPALARGAVALAQLPGFVASTGLALGVLPGAGHIVAVLDGVLLARAQLHRFLHRGLREIGAERLVGRGLLVGGGRPPPAAERPGAAAAAEEDHGPEAGDGEDRQH